MPKPLRVALLAAVVAIIGPVSSAHAQSAAAGRVNFAKPAESDFDRYTLSPTDSQKQWMREHYWRMRTYPPYFDSRTSWFGGAWAYRDAYAIYRGSSLASQRPEWILKDPAGNRLYIPFACDGSACTQYAADIGNPAWRRHYIDLAKADVARGYKGVFVDDVNFAFNVSNGAGDHVAPIDPRTGTTMTHESWQRYFAEFMEQLRAELPASAEIVQNQVYFHVGLGSPYVRRAIDAATHLEVERGVNDTGIRGGSGPFGFETVLGWVDYAHQRGKGVIWDVQADWGREYALATYFLASTGNDGLSVGAGSSPDGWWSGWDTDLGAPTGGRYAWNGVFRRDFQRGSVFVNQPDQPARTLAPGGTWRRLDGTRVTSIGLATRDGVVLLRDDGTPPPPPPPQALPAPGPTDLAAGQPTNASSTQDASYPSTKGNDGAGSSRWSSTYTDNQWWEVDLGSMKSVARVDVDWEAAYPSRYQILTSADGTNWNEAATVTLARAAPASTTFTPRNARYVRVLGVKRATVYGISFWEARVYGPTAGTPGAAPSPPSTPPAGGRPPARRSSPPVRRSAPAEVKTRRAFRRAALRRCLRGKRAGARRRQHAGPRRRAACRGRRVARIRRP